ALGLEGGVARDDEVHATVQRPPRQAFPGLAAHDHRLAERQLAEPAQVGPEPPGQGAAATDDAVAGPGHGPERETHAAHWGGGCKATGSTRRVRESRRKLACIGEMPKIGVCEPSPGAPAALAANPGTPIRAS